MKALVFDNETTGLLRHLDVALSKQPKVIEFGAHIIDENYEVIHTLEVLINPEEPLEPIITKITGLVDEDLADKPIFEKVQKKIRKFITKADCAFAHNMPFDKGVLDCEFQRLGKNPDFGWPNQLFCTVQMNVAHYGYRVKLVQRNAH